MATTPEKPKAFVSNVHRVEEKRKLVTPEILSRAMASVARALADRPAGRLSAEVRLSDDFGFIVDGADCRIAADHGDADCGFWIAPENLARLLRGDIEPRAAIVFLDIRILYGEARDVIAVCDHLQGRTYGEIVLDRANLPTPTTDLTKATADLREFGYALVQDAIAPDHLAALRDRLLEQIDGEMEGGIAKIDADNSALRVQALLNKGRVFHDLLLNPVIEEIVADLIGEHFIMKSFSASIALPGDVVGLLHIDQAYVQPPVPQFPLGVNILWFLDDVSETNGGTRVIPRSHLGGLAPADPFSIEGTIAAEGPAGTALLVDSRTWHAVGPNKTNDRRHMLTTYFMRSYMRAGENYFLSLRPGLKETFDERVMVMLGYRCTGSLGAVEGPIEGQMNNRPINPVGELRPRAPRA